MVNSKWNLTGVHGINRYLWAKLQSELEWNINNTRGIVPIVPAGQQPELNDVSAPYIVYNYAHHNSYDEWWLQVEQITYTIFSHNEKDIRQAINLIRELGMRRDESAQAVNSWITQNGTEEQKRFDYKYIENMVTLGAQPPIQEGGRQDGSVVLRTGYVYGDFVNSTTDATNDRLSI